jgi:hypothetical protein
MIKWSKWYGDEHAMQHEEIEENWKIDTQVHVSMGGGNPVPGEPSKLIFRGVMLLVPYRPSDAGFTSKQYMYL